MKRTLLLLTLCAAPAAAQTSSSSNAQPNDSGDYPVLVSVGWSAVTLPYGIGANASLSTRRNAWSFGLGYDHATHINEQLTMASLSMRVGTHARAGWMNYAVSAGPASMWGRDGLDEQGFAVGNEQYRTPGAIAEASALLGSRLQIGVGAWGSVNARRVNFGVGPRLLLRLP